MFKEEIEINLSSRIQIGLGILQNLNKKLSYMGFNRPLILLDSNIYNSDYFLSLSSALKKISSKGKIYDLEVKGEPTYRLLSEILDNLDMSHHDCVISLGGGSTMDVGKALALLATNPSNPLDLKGFPINLKTPLPHITIPSILGSGSEASFNAVFIDENEEKKLGINSINNFPILVLVDPLLTMSAPLESTLSSSLDALVHCVDSFGSQKSNTFSRMFSIEGFKNVWKFLCEDNFDEPSLRLLLALGSIQGIYGLMNSGDGPANGFAYYFGVKNKIPHGFAGGMFLGDIMFWNFKNGFNGYESLLKGTQTKNIESFVERYKNLLEKYKVPKLSNYGYEKEGCEHLSLEVSSALTGSFSGNPIEFSSFSAEWVLKKQFGEI